MHDIALLAIIWTSVFVASYLAHKTRLTPVLWYLFCGALLVNIGILPQVMPVFIVDFAELGIIIIMFALGFEESTSNFIKGIKRSWGIALFGALVPFAVGYFFADAVWQDTNTSLFVGLAMTATAVSLTMVSLKSEGLNNTPAASGIMTSAVLDDIASLALVAILVPIAIGETSVSIIGIFFILSKAIAFFIVVTFLGAWLFPVSNGFAAKIPFLGKLNLRSVLSMAKGEYTVLSLLLIAVLVGLLAHEFGFHPAVGAYMAGLIIQKEYFDFYQNEERDHYKHAREIIDNVAFSWIGPVFFVALGSKLIFEATLFLAVLPYAMILFIGLFVGQVLSAALAARYTGNFDWPSSWMIGFGMLGRAELAFVVLDIAYVQYNIISMQVFYTLMLVTFLLNLSVPLCIHWQKKNLKIESESEVNKV
jgi:Kef-type K+ transport system membrane component KefB